MIINNRNIIFDPREIARTFENEKVIAFDTETTGLSPWTDRIAIMQFYGVDTDEVAVYQCINGVVPDEIKGLFTPDKLFIAHNAISFDIQFLATAGVPWQKARWYDTLVGETVVIGTGRKDVSAALGPTLNRRLGVKVNKNIDHAGWAKETLTENQLIYATEDVVHLPALMSAQVNIARDSEQLNALKMEQQLVPVFAQMTVNGLPIQSTILDNYVERQQNMIDELRPGLVASYGNINFNSPAQLLKAMAANGVHLTNTQHDTLTEYVKTRRENYEIVQQLLDFRLPAQRVKMYGGQWAERYLIDNRVHPRFWPCGTDTGRVSSSDPNLQQVPRDARFLIGNLPGYKIVSCDYSQIEVRVAAYIADDKQLMTALDEEDVHTAIAAQVFGVEPAAVTAAQRKMSKAATFTMLFAGGVDALYSNARSMGSDLTHEDAERIFVDFLNQFKGLAQQREWAKDVARRDVVYVRLKNGLRRGLVGNMKRPQVIINTLVQGNAAVGMKLGLLEAGRQGLHEYIGATVHDELVATVPEAEADDYADALSAAMIKGMKELIPLHITTDKVVHTNWGQVDDIKGALS